MRRLVPLKLALVSVLIAACVTINVYFPAAAAEKAADKIIEDVWGKDQAPAATPPSDQTSNLAPQAQRMLFAAAGAVLDFVIPAANAQADLDIATPEIRAITASMEGRHGSLSKYYASGAVGFTGDGMVEVRDQNAIPLPERNAARQLVADENKDRAALYAAIAKANAHPEWETEIRETFAKRWIAKAQAGWWYKDAGGWKQK
ncbi:MAG TPA: DUF1318 domain-containing protein [Steroidobacteraceae bacterium]|nr:DUF1318 domain-containing protein [Steroidobacteraceae bacterium]